MKIRLIAVDMDGTVLRTDRTVSERTAAALQKAAERGCVVVPASGRVAGNLPKQVVSIPGIRYAITSNGASVIDMLKKVPIYSDLMDAETSRRLVERLLSEGYFAEAYCGGTAYSDRNALNNLKRLNPPEEILSFIEKSQIFVDDLPKYLVSHRLCPEKINLPFLPHGKVEGLRSRLGSNKKYTLCSSLSDNIEINRAGCSKGKALEHLCGLLEIRREEVLAVGDGGNDLTMLRFAGTGVAMRNASPQALAAADCVTATNDEDGVALAVEKFAFA